MPDELLTTLALTPAHDQKVTIHLVEHIPAHGPRGAAFEAAKRRMEQLGLNKCVIEGCDTRASVEYHHTYVENSLQGGVDVDKLNRAFGLHLTDDQFKAWVQSPGNLEPLCSTHHRTQLGIHVLPEPLWNAVRVWRKDLSPPAEQA